MKTKLLPIGVDNFATLVNYRNEHEHPYLFIDKTMLIDAFLESGDTITLITRPRRFGKTLNLSMLEHFFSTEVDGVTTKGLFDGLKVSEHPNTMAYQGESPTIFLSLKSLKGKSFKAFYARFQVLIKRLFNKHSYLLKTNLTPSQKEDFNAFTTGKASPADYESSLVFLSQLLYAATGKKVIVLLDEYDTPMHDAYVKDYYQDCAQFLAGLFGNTFKGNNYLYKAMITGILRVAKASLFSELNNVKVYSNLNDKRYGAYFGFTETETNQLLDEAGLPKKAHDLKEMYNGYQIGNYTLYNPFSIVFFASEALLDKDQMQEAIQPYWNDTGGTHLITELLKNNLHELEEDMRRLLQGHSITTLIDKEVKFTPTLRDNPIAFWSLMLLAGYLKVVRKEEADDDLGEPNYTLCFPNKEVKHTFRLLTLEVAARHTNYMPMVNACRELVKGHTAPFTSYLQKHLKDAASAHDVKGRYKEQFFHGLLLGITACLASNYDIRSNRESGKGRYDIALIPKDTTQLGVILELKIVGKKDDLNKTAQQALAQIVDLEYASQMESLGVKQIMKIGIAFRGKEIAWTHSRD